MTHDDPYVIGTSLAQVLHLRRLILAVLKRKITDDPHVIGISLAQVPHTRRLMLTALKRKIADDPYVGGTYLLAKSLTLDISCLYTQAHCR